MRQALRWLAIALATSCGDRSPTAPPQPPAPSASGIPFLAPTRKPGHATQLLACVPLPQASVTRVIGAHGGTISIGPHTLVIPAGAVQRTVSITADIQYMPKGLTAKTAVQANAVRFQPGLKFLRPAYLTMSYANCEPRVQGSLVPKKIAYTNEAQNVILEEEASLDDPNALKVTASIDHFSNYAVAW